MRKPWQQCCWRRQHASRRKTPRSQRSRRKTPLQALPDWCQTPAWQSLPCCPCGQGLPCLPHLQQQQQHLQLWRPQLTCSRMKLSCDAARTGMRRKRTLAVPWQLLLNAAGSAVRSAACWQSCCVPGRPRWWRLGVGSGGAWNYKGGKRESGFVRCKSNFFFHFNGFQRPIDLQHFLATTCKSVDA